MIVFVYCIYYVCREYDAGLDCEQGTLFLVCEDLMKTRVFLFFCTSQPCVRELFIIEDTQGASSPIGVITPGGGLCKC
jgi:hypothetical protein